MPARFYQPSTHDDQGYFRYPPVAEWRGKCTAKLRATAPLPTDAKVRLVGKRPDGTDVLLESPAGLPIAVTGSTSVDYAAVFDSTLVPDGSYVLDCVPAPEINPEVIVCNQTAVARDVPRMVAVASCNMIEDEPPSGPTYTFIPYPQPLRAFPMATRNAARWPSRSTWANSYVQLMTRTCGVKGFLREFAVTQSGNVCTTPRQRYTSTPARLGDERDGPRGICGIGSPTAGRVFANGDLLALSRTGSLFRLTLDGTRTTIAGWRTVGMPPRYSAEGVTEPTWFDRESELVGGVPFDQAQDMALDEAGGYAYIADSIHNRILRVQLSSGVVSVLPTDANFPLNHPTGCELSDDGRTLYVGNDRNCEILALATGPLTWSRIVQSAARPGGSMLAGLITNDMMSMLRMDFSMPGKFGEAKFMHVGKIRFDSQGRLVAIVHHSFELWRFDLTAKTCEKLLTFTIGDGATTTRTSAWFELAVDRWGATGAVDDIFVAGWYAGSEWRFDKNGANLPHYVPTNPPKAPWLWNGGPTEYQMAAGYPWMLAPDPQGALWHADTASSTIWRQTPRRATDEVPPPGALYNTGARLWKTAPPGGVPLALLLGTDGFNQLGFPLIEELGRMKDADLRTWLAGKGWTASADQDALVAYIIGRTPAARLIPDGEDPAMIAQLQQENADLKNQLTAAKAELDAKTTECAKHDALLAKYDPILKAFTAEIDALQVDG